jgi:hypothetical protein
VADLAFIVLIFAFFAICAGYVRAADRMIEKARVTDEKPDDGISV